jgi:hypothetical protein
VVSKALGAPDDSLLLGRDATERALRNRPLNDYRVISFATHAFVAGDIEGIFDPALVLTPGSQATPANDGLLTATEIANLDLDANLVILSACNTAAADGAASGRGLSGLANAFFFAGARSVAVTQWAVFSEVAQTFGAGLITRSIGPDGVGVAEALRRTMVDYISNAKEDYRAHPRFWAAFSIAGDGAIKPLDGGAVGDRGGETVSVISDHLTRDASQLSFTGVVKLSDTGAIYAVGGLKPAAGTQYSGSYLSRLDPADGSDVISVDPTIAAGPIATVRNGIILLENTYTQERKSAAVFRLMDKSGKEVWRFTEDGPLYDVPIGAVDVPQGHILVSTAEDWSGSPTPSPSKLVINLVSTTGELISRHEYVVADRALSTRPSGLIVKGKNHDLIVIINKLLTPAEENLPVWVINPLTGFPPSLLGWEHDHVSGSVVGNCTCTEPERTNVFPSGAKSRNSMSLTPSYLNTVSGCNAVFSLASSIPCCSRHSRAVLNATKIFPSDRRRERTATLERAAASVAIHPGRHEGRSSERRSIEDAADLLAFLPLKRDFKGRDGAVLETAAPPLTAIVRQHDNG